MFLDPCPAPALALSLSICLSLLVYLCAPTKRLAFAQQEAGYRHAQATAADTLRKDTAAAGCNIASIGRETVSSFCLWQGVMWDMNVWEECMCNGELEGVSRDLY